MSKSIYGMKSPGGGGYQRGAVGGRGYRGGVRGRYGGGTGDLAIHTQGGAQKGSL